MINNNLLISDADEGTTQENLITGASNRSLDHYQDILKEAGVDYIQ